MKDGWTVVFALGLGFSFSPFQVQILLKFNQNKLPKELQIIGDCLLSQEGSNERGKFWVAYTIFLIDKNKMVLF